jgi:hypothetical protein
MLANTLQRQSENIETKTVVKSLPCTLTREESHNYAKDCARLIRELEIVEREKKDAMNGFKERIDGINTMAGAISEKVNANQEFRDIDCNEEFDYLKLRVRTVRTDTGEVVEDRRMTAKEMQRPLFGGDDE